MDQITFNLPLLFDVLKKFFASSWKLLQSVRRAPSKTAILHAHAFDSGFTQSHDTYNGMIAASDGKIYYVLSSSEYDIAGQMYSYDPSAGRINHLGDLTEACGEKGLKVISQGKSHVNFVESNGKLYFATHIGYYNLIEGMERPGIPPPGWDPYRGGHFLAYDLASGKIKDLALAPHGEGIHAMTMDPGRGRLYGLSWPTGHFLRFDLAEKKLKDLGPVSLKGESGKGSDYRSLCRSLQVDPDDGSTYLTTSDGWILRYRYDRDAIEKVEGDDMKKDYFGCYDPTSPGTMGYNWRQTFWYAPEKKIYGIHGNSGYAFRFDPHGERVEVLDRLTSKPSQRSGLHDAFSYGYLGFTLGPDSRTIYYLTGGPIYEDGKRVTGKATTARGEAKGLENLHLVTYDIPTRKYSDHGAIYYENGERPTYVNSIAVSKEGTVYTLARVVEHGRTRTDLISIPGPFQTHSRHNFI